LKSYVEEYQCKAKNLVAAEVPISKKSKVVADLSPFQYQLLDFGQGRKLEKFGDHLLDRYSPSAEGFKAINPSLWKNAHARYARTGEGQGIWENYNVLPKTWTVQAGSICFEVKPTRFGHLGIFPEQFSNWKWLLETCRQSPQRLKVLNLFAYTGGSSLACALGGAEVTHVDAAGNTVKWGRHNAEISGLGEATIRWITEDARKFVKREAKRENYYDGVILDPPTYGHGAKGEVWRIGRDLPLLLGHLKKIMPEPKFALFTCHSPGHDTATLTDLLLSTFDGMERKLISSQELGQTDLKNRKLPSGHSARFSVI